MSLSGSDDADFEIADCASGQVKTCPEAQSAKVMRSNSPDLMRFWAMPVQGLSIASFDLAIANPQASDAVVFGGKDIS